MTDHSLSVVQLCPDAHKSAAEAIAEGHGYGTGNLSVELRHTDGPTWWGCHAWWVPELLAAAVNPPDEVPGTAEVLAHVVTSVVNTGELLDTDGTVLVAAMTSEALEGLANAHWLEALAANGLSVVEIIE